MKQLRMAALCLACMAPTAQACPSQVPEGLKAVPVANDVVTHQLNLSISQVQGSAAVEDILNRTAAVWKAGGYDLRRSKAAGWEILSALGKGCLVTLQLTSRDGAFGYLARSKQSLGVAPTAASRGVPLPHDVKLLSSVASDDSGRRGLVLSMTSNYSLDEINGFFLQQLTDNQWQAPRSNKVVNTKSRVTTLFVTAQRARARVEIVAWHDRSTQILMTISDAL